MNKYIYFVFIYFIFVYIYFLLVVKFNMFMKPLYQATSLSYCTDFEFQYTYSFGKCSAMRQFNLSQMKHRLDATLCRFYFCRVTQHVSGASAHHQE